MPTPSIFEIRRRCRQYAIRFNYPDILFNTIPTYIFQYFCLINPLEVVPGPFDPMDIMNIFMIINNISADLMMAFYAAGDQELDNVLRIHDYLLRMWQLYNQARPEDLFGLFGTFFAYHMETRTLRRIDMTIVNHNRGQRQPTHFVPNQVNWRRAREVRLLFRRGQYTIGDEFDLAEFRMAWYGGLRNRRGRYNNH